MVSTLKGFSPNPAYQRAHEHEVKWPEGCTPSLLALKQNTWLDLPLIIPLIFVKTQIGGGDMGLLFL